MKTNRRSSLTVEHLESKNLMAGDLSGAFGESAELMVDGNSQAVRPEIDFGTQIGEHLYFLAQDGSGDYEVWKSDGTQDGTERFAEVYGNVPANESFRRGCCNIVGAGDHVYFVIDRVAPEFEYTADSYYRWLGVSELWTSDGTDAGTNPLTHLMVFSRDDGLLSLQMLEHNGQLLVRSTSSSSFGLDEQIWVSDGSPDGTNYYHRAVQIGATWQTAICDSPSLADTARFERI